ncbi:Mitochondrial inner membrane protein OXA1-like [Actinidia chinensis var. chinensis]|uniref:Mitochondrial inner membrane protein OXA1-like n=1 Tax=Actinidia chinensis var. chinensis TaxID=1590841 RepID=A0A2R6Q8M5_ACTCC|nr:Mitochondrial inner membrane protein OXA1-like [Actinidia chinensis var. chinensis]
MVCRRSISARATLFARQRFSPSFSYIHRDDNRKHNEERGISTFASEINSSSGFGTSFYGQRSSQFFASSMIGSFFGRHMSMTVDEGAENIEYMTDVSEVFSDPTVEVVTSAAPAVNEVAIAAATFPVAALQHLIDGVHSLTGFNWWASIIVTLLIRGATVPLLINQLKSTTKLSGMDPKAVTEGQQRMQALFKGYGVTPFTPLKDLLFQGPVFISFFLSIWSMVEKVLSFKYGRAYWFTDLTTPDSLYIFPVFDSTVILDNGGVSTCKKEWKVIQLRKP